MKMEDYSINISVKTCSNIPNVLAEIVNFHFSHYKSMGTISCHSNQSSYPTRIKKHNLCRGYCPKHVSQVSASSQIWFLKKIFKHCYENRPFLPSQQPIKFTDLDKSHLKHRGLLNNHFCKKIQIRQKKLSISSFPIISLWELKAVIATRVLIRLEQKKHNYSFPLPIDAIYEI